MTCHSPPRLAQTCVKANAPAVSFPLTKILRWTRPVTTAAQVSIVTCGATSEYSLYLQSPVLKKAIYSPLPTICPSKPTCLRSSAKSFPKATASRSRKAPAHPRARTSSGAGAPQTDPATPAGSKACEKDQPPPSAHRSSASPKPQLAHQPASRLFNSALQPHRACDRGAVGCMPSDARRFVGSNELEPAFDKSAADW